MDEQLTLIADLISDGVFDGLEFFRVVTDFPGSLEALALELGKRIQDRLGSGYDIWHHNGKRNIAIHSAASGDFIAAAYLATEEQPAAVTPTFRFDLSLELRLSGSH